MGKVIDVQIDELLKATDSTHGFWLINHREVISESLKSGLISYGLQKMIELLKDSNSVYTKNLYHLIKVHNS